MIFASTADNLLISVRSAWLSRNRGFAVFAGVLLSTLVLTAILAYGTSLSQIAMQETIKNISYDGVVYFKNEPDYKSGSRTSVTSEFSDICTEFTNRVEFTDCTLVFAQQGYYRYAYTDNRWEAEFKARYFAQDIRLESIDTLDVEDDEIEDNPNRNPVMFLEPGGIDGQLGNIYAEKLVDGSWFASAFDDTSGSVLIPQRVANARNLAVGDSLNLTYSFVTDKQERDQEITCESSENGNESYLDKGEWDTQFCRQKVLLENVSVTGIYKPSEGNWRGNDLSGRILLTTASLNSKQIEELMDTDHALLVFNIDRSLIPSSSIEDAEIWLDELEKSMEGSPSNPVTYGDVEINYEDGIVGYLSDISIFVVLIQIFDYILMIPAIFLSLAVLVYGLNLALEQRRSEIAIHRVYGGTNKSLLGLILSEVFIISTVAWTIGYFLGILSAEFIANTVGFMEFEKSEFALSPKVSVIPTIVIFVVTVGLSMMIGFVKTKRFLSMDIEEGIKKEIKPKRNRVIFLIHILLFLLGLSAVAINIMNLKLSIITGLISGLGPFTLWIGGSVVFARLSGYAPRVTTFLLGKTKILSDVRIGIRGSELNRSMNQLGLIVVLTISIVTMAAFQGYTGSLVDERSASSSVGADIKINLSTPMSDQEVNTLLTSSIDNITLVKVPYPKNIASLYNDTVGIKGQRYSIDIAVLTSNHRDVLHWNDQSVQGGLSVLTKLSEPGFTSGVDAAETLDLAVKSDEGGLSGVISPFNAFEDDDGVGFDSITLTYPYVDQSEVVTQNEVTVGFIGGHNWIPGVPQDKSNSFILIDDSTFKNLNDNADYKAIIWFVELCDEKANSCLDALEALSEQLESNPTVTSVEDWSKAYDEVKRNGGLIFGTPGILSLQYIVAAFAALASSLVFLSLILARRRRELAILQSIGASATQLSRLVIFEIISVFTLSLVLGGLLGLGLAEAFTGLFSLLGGLFQLLLESETVIARELVWPWIQVLLVNGLVFVAVLIALLFTTLRAVRSDLPTVLKEE